MWGLGLRVLNCLFVESGFQVLSGLRVPGLGFRVEVSGFWLGQETSVVSDSGSNIHEVF